MSIYNDIKPRDAKGHIPKISTNGKSIALNSILSNNANVKNGLYRSESFKIIELLAIGKPLTVRQIWTNLNLNESNIKRACSTLLAESTLIKIEKHAKCPTTKKTVQFLSLSDSFRVKRKELGKSGLVAYIQKELSRKGKKEVVKQIEKEVKKCSFCYYEEAKHGLTVFAKGKLLVIDTLQVDRDLKERAENAGAKYCAPCSMDDFWKVWKRKARAKGSKNELSKIDTITYIQNDTLLPTDSDKELSLFPND